MEELDTLLQNLDIENKIIKLLCAEVKAQKDEIAALKNAIKVKEAEYLTEEEAIKVFKTSRVTLWRLVANNSLLRYKQGKNNRYKYEDLKKTFANPQNFYYGNTRR